MHPDDPKPTPASLLPLIQRALSTAPHLSAGEIARRLGCDRGDVVRTIDAYSRHFARVAADRWRLAGAEATSAMPSAEPPEADSLAGLRMARGTEAGPVAREASMPGSAPAAPRRPGPFGPARDLLPPNARIEMVSVDTAVSTAIETMSEKDYSQLLVRGRDARAIGVFSWKQFSLRAHGLQQLNRSFKDVLASPVEQFMRQLRPSDCIAPDQYVDTDVDWVASDFVIVGTPELPMGILTISDVWGILNDFAEAFVLLHEIELSLRTLVEIVAPEDWRGWLDSMHVPAGQSVPASLEDLTLHQYSVLICKKENRWNQFASLIGGLREIFHADLMNVVGIRNDVMHFRRKATPTMCGHLKEFRDRLRTSVRRSQGLACRGSSQ